MIPKELSAQLQQLPSDQVRTFTDSYIEIVYLQQDVERWTRALQEFFGPPAKARGTRPSRAVDTLTEEHGGIDKGQTLFAKEGEEGLVAAMLWPWQDGKHTTLKIFTAPKPAGWDEADVSPSILGRLKKLFAR
jgi:hypothetical protein